MSMARRIAAAFLTVGLLCVLAMAPASGAPAKSESAGSDRAGYWTAARRAAATPRDLVLDERGRGYLRLPDGTLRPYGGGTPVPRDQVGPVIADRSPADGTAFSTSTVTFRATVTDTADGVKSVTFNVGPSGGSKQAYAGAHIGNNVWEATVSGFADGAWTWTVTARDTVKRKGGNATTTAQWGFTVGTSGSGGGTTEPTTGPTIIDAEWTADGAVQTAIGRIYFEMPANKSLTRWSGYVCSGTVADDGNIAADGVGGTNRQAVVVTAAHCVYDDVYKAFARNVMFIPNQADGGSGTDRDCTNDPLGCWEASHGAVDVNWTNRAWPDNIPWDYAYYVVPDDRHLGNGGAGDLDGIAGALVIQFDPPPGLGDYTHALGYSYAKDPQLRYCAEGLATEASYRDWWLGSCELSGGSSGGPWIQNMDTQGGSGKIMSVNSWGYSNSPGMAGPRLHDTSASCVFGAARTSTGNLVVKTCP